MTDYYRIKGRDTFHWHQECQKLKRMFAASARPEYKHFIITYRAKPRGDQCNECLAKTKADKRKRE